MKRHQKTHTKGPPAHKTSTNLPSLTKVEKQEVVEVEEEELSSELHIEDEEAAGQLLTEYNQEPLEVERAVRVPNRNL